MREWLRTDPTTKLPRTFNERSWHRVLSAELLRTYVHTYKQPLAKWGEHAPHPTTTQDSTTFNTEAKQWLDLDLHRHLLRAEHAHTCNAFDGMIRAYAQRFTRIMHPKSLFQDHRIRKDSAQRVSMVQYLRDTTEARSNVKHTGVRCAHPEDNSMHVLREWFAMHRGDS